MSGWECKHPHLVVINGAEGLWWCKDCGAVAFHHLERARPGWAHDLKIYPQWVGPSVGLHMLCFVYPRGHGEPPRAFGLTAAVEEMQARAAAYQARSEREQTDDE